MRPKNKRRKQSSEETKTEPKAEAPKPSAGGGSTREVKVPDIGDFDEVDVIEVLVKAGDTVEKEDSLITLESDKATMEVPAPFAGTVKEVKVGVGDKVSEGTLIAMLETAEGASEAAPESEGETAAPTPQKGGNGEAPLGRRPDEPVQLHHTQHPAHYLEADQAPVEPARIDSDAHRRAHASPAVRKFARELGVDLSQVRGSGPKNRILKEDVQGYVKGAMQRLGQPGGVEPAAAGAGIPPVPAVDFSKFGEVEEVALSRIKKLSGANLHRSWLNVPHVTQFDKADITELEAFRKAQKEEGERRGVKLTPLAFLVKAAVAGLQQFPEFNSSLNPAGDALIMKKYFHIGVAVDTPDGLLVPVIKDADKLSLFGIAEELQRLSQKARDKKLSPGEMQGACFSISSLGGIGGTAFTPVVNAPEVAILGVSKSSMEPVWNGKEFAPRLMLPLSLSYDHRVVDGALAARFTTYLSGVLGDIRRLLL